jgi:hypothetical protein
MELTSDGGKVTAVGRDMTSLAWKSETVATIRLGMCGTKLECGLE